MNNVELEVIENFLILWKDKFFFSADDTDELILIHLLYYSFVIVLTKFKCHVINFVGYVTKYITGS